MDGTRRVQVLSSGFVGFLGFPAAELVRLGPPWPAAVAAAAGLVVFGGLFVWVVWHNAPRPHSAATPYALAGMVVTAVALQFALRETWLLTASFYLVTLLILVLPRRAWVPALAGFWAWHAALAVLVLDRPFGSAALVGGGVTLYGAALGVGYWVFEVGGELRAARAELARAAIASERLRIARDLHDVLGQRLTEVVLKSEVSARLAAAEPERAAAEMREVSRTARAILAEVRATVSGYREVDLDSEIATAREITAAAGVELTVRLPPEPPPPAVAAVAAWVVREGVTNTLRHSMARTCVIVIAVAPATRAAGRTTAEYVGELAGRSSRAAEPPEPSARAAGTIAAGANAAGANAAGANAAGVNVAGVNAAGEPVGATVTVLTGEAAGESARDGAGGGRVFTVIVADDGPARGPRRRVEPGTGLTGLAERLAAVGGTLSVEVEKEWFMLGARIPEGAE